MRTARAARIRPRGCTHARRDRGDARRRGLPRDPRTPRDQPAHTTADRLRDVRARPRQEGAPRAAAQAAPLRERTRYGLPLGDRAGAPRGPGSFLRSASPLEGREGRVHDRPDRGLLPRHRRRARADRPSPTRCRTRARRGRRGAVRVRVRRHARALQRRVRSRARLALAGHREPLVRGARRDRAGLQDLRPAPRRRAVQVRPRRTGPLALASRGGAGVRRVAMLSVHACPMARLGGRDSGGMNVYVRELARELGRRGTEVDVFTRWREKDDPRIQSLGENARVIHIASGPMGYWPKMDVYEHLDEFTTKLQEHVAAEGKRYDLIHSHYWLSAEVARVVAPRWGVPRIQMFHTLGLVKREVMDEDVDGESDVRVAIERQAVQESAAIVAASRIERGELRDLYGADPAKVHVIPCGVDTTLFHPIRQADARERLGRDQCERIVLFVGRIEQIKGIDVLLRALDQLF